jgi:hypothetical protein
MATKKIDVVGMIMDFESGSLDDKNILVLFAELIKSKMAYSLQGSYGRTATELISQGYISENGTILKSV